LRNHFNHITIRQSQDRGDGVQRHWQQSLIDIHHVVVTDQQSLVFSHGLIQSLVRGATAGILASGTVGGSHHLLGILQELPHCRSELGSLVKVRHDQLDPLSFS
jgi:hypothetical protein